ncbi:hypothetical protein OSTOST_13254 [Ostertagia ostertagi]
MAVYICVELESITGLPEIMNCLVGACLRKVSSSPSRRIVEAFVTHAVPKDDSLQLPTSTSVNPLVPTSTPSSVSLEQVEAYPRSESVDSDVNEKIKIEDYSAQFRDAETPMNDEMDETDLVACGSELLQQVSANFSSYQERTKNFTDNEMSMVREKGAGSAPKQCQVDYAMRSLDNGEECYEHMWRRISLLEGLFCIGRLKWLRCTLCGQGFDRMNRASIHVEKCHAGDSGAKVESAMNAEQRKEIEMLARKCFPRRNRSSGSEESK